MKDNMIYYSLLFLSMISEDENYRSRLFAQNYRYMFLERKKNNLQINAHTACPFGWTNFTNSCYYFHTDTRTSWSEATRLCSAHHAHIVFIESEAEDKFLVGKLRHLVDTSSDHDSETGVWTGGTDEIVEGVWMWYGNDIPISGYTNWYPGEPDTGDGKKEEDCLCLVGDKQFKWQDYRCQKDMFFICEKATSGGSTGGALG